MATTNKKPGLGAAYDYFTNKRVVNQNELINPQGGTDGELMRQWHLKHLGDIGTIWNDFTGKGVTVGVYDEGTQQAHWDLDDNYDASNHVVVDGVVFDGGIATGAHGTAVGGLIAAERNGRGGVGVAYDATLTGVNIFDPDSPIFVNGGGRFIDAMLQLNRFDITNHSWGAYTGYALEQSRGNPNSYSAVLGQTFEYAAQTGRDGLGSITVMAAGNDRAPGQGNAGVTDRHAIAVAAYRQEDGAASSYSNSGGHLLVSAPSSDYKEAYGSSQVTTDLLGTAGYNWSVDPRAANDYTDQFGGTSGAAPIVSGVVALMLDANENLGWRDVQNILAASAKMPVAFETKSAVIEITYEGNPVTIPLNESAFKLTGGGANWNGGRMHFSNDYGYGAVDAYNATRMAEVWGLFAGAKTSANEVHVTQNVAVGLSAFGSADKPTPNTLGMQGDITGDIVRKTFTIDSNVALERLDLSVVYENLQTQTDRETGQSASAFSEFLLSQIKLIAPDGSQAFVPVVGQIAVAEDIPYKEFTFGFSGLRGVESKGEWTLEFSTHGLVFDWFGLYDLFIDNLLTINNLKLDMYGSEVTNDDVHTYTNEFFTMNAIAGESARRTLVDTDGGTDWINAAAVSHNVKLSLVAGQATSFDGARAFAIGRTSEIENAVTGDGNDTLIGNRLDNILVGMRGNDVLNGGMGNDRLIGGQGGDRFLFDNRGVSGKDAVLDFTGGDMIGTQTALRGAGADGRITVAADTLLLLDGTRAGDTAQLSQQGGAVIQSLGQRDGYFWYAFVSGTDIDSGEVIREASFQPSRTAEGALAAMGDAVQSASDAFGGATLAGAAGDHGSFYLYDAMAGSMSGGVLLHA